MTTTPTQAPRFLILESGTFNVYEPHTRLTPLLMAETRGDAIMFVSRIAQPGDTLKIINSDSTSTMLDPKGDMEVH